jgi:hypothetical protein
VITARTFSDSHYVSFPAGRLKVRQRLREEAMRFVTDHLRDDQVVSLTEATDEYVSSVTVWYWSGGAEHQG